MENQEKHSNQFNNDFEHGYTTGVEQVDKSTYEAFLSSHVSYEWLQERIAEKQESVAKIDAKIEETKEKNKFSFDKLQEYILGVSVAGKNVSYVQEKLDKNKERISFLEHKKTTNESPYAFLAGILYLLAGVAFVAGDLIISHEIVAYALNIRNNFEAWAFAVGLAMLSVLLKPAYERLIEQPYLTEKTEKAKRNYAVFQGFLLTFAVGTMLILGWFRYEAYRTDKLKEGINKQIKNLQLNAQPLDISTQPTNNELVIKQMDEQMRAYDKLNLELVNSPWALASFVLSGVLFALAGAICLGIAFPILQAYWYRWLQANPALKKLKKEQLVLTEEIQGTEKIVAEQMTQKNILEHDLQLLSNIDELKAERKTLLEEIAKHLHDSKLADADRRINTFFDGVAIGDANRQHGMTEEEYEVFRSSFFHRMKNAQDSRPENSPKIYRSNGLRPHQALRKAITNQFNEN